MKQRKSAEIAVLVTLHLAGVAMWYYYTRPPAEAAHASTVSNYKPMKVENPQIHWERLAEAQNTEYKPSPRDIFSRDLPPPPPKPRSEEHTSELQSHSDLVCRLLLEKKNK